MTPLTATNTTAANQIDYSEKGSFDAQFHELAKGILYTIDKAWEEFDKI